MKNRNNIETDELLHVIRETIRDAIKECTTQTQSKEFYTMKEVAEIWGVNLQTIYRYTKLGMLQCTHVGRHVRYDKDYIDNLESLGKPRDRGLSIWNKAERNIKIKK